MATLSNSSLRGSTDPQVSTQEESTGSEEDIKLSTNEVKKTSKEFAELLRVDKSTEDKAVMEGFENILFRIDEFKGQLDRIQDRVTNSSETLRDLYKETEQLKSLFKKIDDIERFVKVVGSNVEEMEAFLDKTEKEIDPGRMKRVLGALPRFLKPKSLKPATSPTSSERKFLPPKTFSCEDFFLQDDL